MFGGQISLDQGSSSLLSGSLVASRSAVRQRKHRLSTINNDEEDDRGYEPPTTTAAHAPTFSSSQHIPPYRVPIQPGAPLLNDTITNTTNDNNNNNNNNKLKIICLYIQMFFNHYYYYIQHSYIELKKRPFHYILGTISCLLVVSIASICYTLIARAPVIFLAQAEGEVGQYDALITPGGMIDARYINYTQFDINTRRNIQNTYHSPRYSVDALAYPLSCTQEAESLSLSLTHLDWTYVGTPELNISACSIHGDNCIAHVCGYGSHSWQLTFIDTERERRMGTGRLYTFPPIPYGEAIITQELARTHSLNIGDTFFISVYFYNILFLLTDNGMSYLSGINYYDSNTTSILQEMIGRFHYIHLPLKINNIIENKIYNKFGSESNAINNILMEYNLFIPYLKKFLHPNFNFTSIEQMSFSLNQLYRNNYTYINNPLKYSIQNFIENSTLTMYDFTQSIIINLSPNRINHYINTDYDIIQQNIINWATLLRYDASFPELNLNLSILEILYNLRFFSLFLGLILSIILTILFILSIMLIYSLLMISIETRTYELGIHRMCGMTRKSIINMLLIQACSYSIPAWIIGLIIGQMMIIIICKYMENKIEIPINYYLTNNSIFIASFLGLIIPLIAAILPIRIALGHNLHDAIDITHSRTSGVTFNIERSENKNINKSFLLIGFGLFMFGFCIYYLLPLSLLSFNISIIFTIFFSLLLGMLFGLILLALNLQPMLERLLLYLLFFWEYRQIPILIEKNLIAHRQRNRKTSIMYALSIGFIIFITIAYEMQIISLKYSDLQSNGAEMCITVRNSRFININGVRNIEYLLEYYSITTVLDYAWVSNRMKNNNNEWDDTLITNIGHAYTSDVGIYAVTPNFYDVADTAFLIVNIEDQTNGLDYAEQLYTVSGSQSAFVGTSTMPVIGIRTLNDSFLINMQKNSPARMQIERMRPAGIFDLTPRFGMSRFPTQRLQNAIVSIPTFIRMSGGRYKTINDMDWAYLLIKFRPEATEANKDKLKEDLKRVIAPFGSAIYDSRDINAALEQSDAVMSIIFGATTYIAMGLCLFSLMASMYTNIYEQTKEIAILRAMGLPSFQIIRIYTYEAFVLVFAASALGLLIGAVIGWTMSAQQNLFTQLPIEMEFPWTFLLLITIGSIVCALIASVVPARALMKKKIATIMRTVL